MSAELSSLALLHERFLLDYPHEAAQALEALPEDAAINALLPLSPAAQLQIWQVLAPDRAAQILLALPAASALQLLAEATPHVGAAALAHVEPTPRAALLAQLQTEAAQQLRMAMDYPANTVGHLMDPRTAALSVNSSIAEAIERLRHLRQRGLRDLFVVDDQMRLLGQIDMESLALASRDRPVREIMRGVAIILHDRDPAREVARALLIHPSTSLPVIDQTDRLVGVIRHAGLLAAVRREGSDVLPATVGASSAELALSSAGVAIRTRLPWLLLNLLTAFLAAAVVGLFESTIAQYTVLAVLLPVVAGQSGYAGAQALAVAVRGFMLRDMQRRQWPQLALKEVAGGLVNGLIIAAAAALGVYIWSRSTNLALIIALAMIISMVIAGLAGALVPVALSRQSGHPTRAMTIWLTTITNVVGFGTFLAIATLLEGRLQP